MSTISLGTENHREMAKRCLQVMRRDDHPLCVRSKIDPDEWKRKFGFRRFAFTVEGPEEKGDETFGEIFSRRGFALKFEQDRVAHQGQWSSSQLQSPGSFGEAMTCFMRIVPEVLSLFLGFEASQTGAHFPSWHGEMWVSD